MTAASPFAQAHASLSELGYSCVPIMAPRAAHKSAGKIPGRYVSGGWQPLESWPELRTAPLSGFALSLALQAPNGNVGLIMGTPAGQAPDGTPLFVMSVDIDTENPEAFDDIVRAIPASPMRAQGAKGWKAFYRAPASIRSRSFDDARIPTGQGLPRRLVDVLAGEGARQAVVAPSVHPAGVTYVWLGDGPIAATALPLFDEGDYERLVETLQMHGYDPEAARQGRGERKLYVPADHTGGDIFDEVKAAALANIGAWIHDVPGLYGLRPARGGFECVNTLRDSSSGQPLERRKRNLSINPRGIRDMGSGDTWSAIDLVADFCGLSVSEAVSWLGERLPGFNDSDVVIDLSGMVAASDDPDADLPAPLRGLGSAPQNKTAPVAIEIKAEATLGAGGARTDCSEAAADATHDVGEMPDHLLDCPGLVGEIAAWMGRTAQKPVPLLNLAAGLCILATAAGRKFAGPTEAGLVCYFLALSGTGTGKAHPIRAGVHLMNAAGMGHMVAPSSWMSGSALIQHLERQPACLSFADEVAEFLAKLSNAKATTHERAVSGHMRELWGTNFGTITPAGYAASRERMTPKPIHSPAYSFMGLSVPEAVWSALQGSDVTNGFLNRFICFSTKLESVEQDPEESVFDVPDYLVDRLREILSFGGSLAHATMHHDGASKPLVTVPWEGGPGSPAHQVFKDLREYCRVQPESETLMKRTAEIAVRLATIRAIGIAGEHAVVTVADIEWGRDVALWSARRMIADAAAYMSETEWQAKAKLVLRYITDTPGRRITRTALCKKIAQRYPPRDLDAIIKGLVESGDITENSSRAGKRGPEALTYVAL